MKIVKLLANFLNRHKKILLIFSVPKSLSYVQEKTVVENLSDFLSRESFITGAKFGVFPGLSM